MTTMIWMVARRAICAAALIAASAELASAAPARIATNTNLRQGPGLSFGVIATAPAGSVVDVIRCGPEWCNVMFGGRPGYMVARNLGRAGPIRIVRPLPPPAVVVEPAYPYPLYGRPYYYGPRVYYGPRRFWRYY